MAQRLKADLISGPDGINDVIKVEQNIALVDPNKTEGRRVRSLLRDLVDTFFGIVDNLTSNTIRGLDQRVDDLTERDDIPAKYRVAGIKVSVLNNASAAEAAAGTDNGPAEYVLLRDSAGPVTAYRNARPLDFRTVKARYVRSDGTLDQRLESYPLLLLDADPHEKGDIVKYIFPGSKTRLFQVLVDVPLAGAGTANPEPTGLENDPYYLAFAPLDSTKPFFVPMPYAQVLAKAQDEQLPQGAQLLITDRGAGLADVYTAVIGPNQVAFDDSYEVELTPSGWTYQAVSYDLGTNTTGQRIDAAAISDIYDYIATLPLGTSQDEKNEIAGRYIVSTAGVKRFYNPGFAALRAAVTSLVSGETFSFERGGRYESAQALRFKNVKILGNAFTVCFKPDLGQYGQFVDCIVDGLSFGPDQANGYGYAQFCRSTFRNGEFKRLNLYGIDDLGALVYSAIKFDNCALDDVRVYTNLQLEYYGLTTAANVQDLGYSYAPAQYYIRVFAKREADSYFANPAFQAVSNTAQLYLLIFGRLLFNVKLVATENKSFVFAELPATAASGSIWFVQDGAGGRTAAVLGRNTMLANGSFNDANIVAFPAQVGFAQPNPAPNSITEMNWFWDGLTLTWINKQY